jgi:hypothetical protein
MAIAMENPHLVDDLPIKKTPFIRDLPLPCLNARGYIMYVCIYIYTGIYI